MIKENSYFDGGVKSLAFNNNNQSISVGVMAVGQYTFGTAAPEKMTVVKGSLSILLKGDTNWQTYSDGEFFNVSGDSSFDVKVTEETAYLCEYL